MFSTASVSGSTECVNISISDDQRVEGDQEFLVTIVGASPQVELPAVISVAVTVDDDDSK